MTANPQGQGQQPQVPPTEFTLFPLLPAELRIKIWNASFGPRVVELHKTIDSNVVDNIPRLRFGPSPWLSNCSNPAALSTCSEARVLALKHFTVPLKVFAPRNGVLTPRFLYINPASDLLVIIGDVDYLGLADLFDTAQARDPNKQRIQRLGLSVTCWLRNFQFENHFRWDKILFSVDVEELVLLMYDQQRPPARFRDGECAVKQVGGMESFTRLFSSAMLERFETGRLRLMNLDFILGPVSRRALESLSS
ncbi:hypothetical protein F4821DRAFT_260415 [Hypoxylon rubiginosum]|uniref:Uncharacterized protein n=1 Tax=Hypoxylon rubiginosum TaxID=110542 RepID=A0ACC0D067_9PEZI|nr:hypothetical protein F4821DRAFT_260415 [Hypoxylon rubiginosum]